MNGGQDTTSIDMRISGVLGRLESVLDHENDRIGSDPRFDLHQTNALKSRCLYDMTMLLRDAPVNSVRTSFADQLAAVRRKLDINALKVKAHMDAVRNVTDMLKDAVAAAEDDGTYSVDQFRSYDLS